MNDIRTKFYGKSYMYKDKVIGVCPTLSNSLFMIGHIKSLGSFQRARIKVFPLFSSVTEAQMKLDEFACTQGLMEVQS